MQFFDTMTDLLPRVFAGLALIAVLFAGEASAKENPAALTFPEDTFAFSNDTVFAYGVDEQGKLTISKKEKVPDFSHRCFVLCRATLQFLKFARFDPAAPEVSDEEYRRIVRQVSRIPVWLPKRPDNRRIIVPGYANLYNFTRGRQGMLKEELGNWLPTYLRIGNWRIVFPMPRPGQAALARWLTRQIDQGRPCAVFLARFPKMNHVVIVYNYRREPGGSIRFIIYDPNYPGEEAWLRFRAGQSSFELQKRWYFPGGRVNALRVYLSPFH